MPPVCAGYRGVALRRRARARHKACELVIIPLMPRGRPRELSLRARSVNAHDAWFHALLRHRDVCSSQRGSTTTGVNAPGTA